MQDEAVDVLRVNGCEHQVHLLTSPCDLLQSHKKQKHCLALLLITSAGLRRLLFAARCR